MPEYDFRSLPLIGGIKRATTDGLVLVEIEKKNAVSAADKQLSGASFSGIYFLMSPENKKIYVGESSDIKKRLSDHCKKSPVAGFEFSKVIFIWDGRPVEISHFTETNLRKALEYVCINAFSECSRYEPVNTVSAPAAAGVYQEASIARFTDELLYLLYEFHLISKPPEEIEPSIELSALEIKELLGRNNINVEIENFDEAKRTIEYGKTTIFYRPGSPKTLGWQITLRDIFLDELFSGKNEILFLFSRNIAFLIPSEFFKDTLSGEKTGVTMDFFIKDREGQLYCHDKNYDINEYRIK